MVLSAKGIKKARVRYSDSEDSSDLDNEIQMVERENEGNDSDDHSDVQEDEERGCREESTQASEEEQDEESNEEDEGMSEEGEQSGSENEEDNNLKDTEMEELEKEYMELRHQEQDILENLKRHKDEDVVKGQAVKNQKALWDKALEFRFLLQKAFCGSNRLPQEPARSSFCALDEQVTGAYSELIMSSKKTLDSLLELQEALLEKNPSVDQSLDGSSGRSAKQHLESEKSDDVDDEEWSKISQIYNRISAFRDKSVDKWQRRTQVSTGSAAIKSKLHAFNQDISEQVAAYMRDPSRMIKQMQQRRSTVAVFGAVPEEVANTTQEEAKHDGDPELLDDTEFYQQLLKEFFEMVDPTSSETAFYALKKLQTKKRKVVDRRASKSRKIRYNVHEKIVNFMAPQPMNLPPMAPKLFENLFGLKSQKAAAEA